MTPARIVAPVGAEVVVLAGICGGDGFYSMNQPLEWILSNDSAGQFIEVGGITERPRLNNLLGPRAKKFDGQYAWGRTSLQPEVIDRGTPMPSDDIELLKGQAFVSLSSASAGTSYVTCVAPKATAWDKRRASTIIQWVDALWSIPAPSSATAGTVHPLTTVVSRNTDGNGVDGWKVRYSIVGGAPAEFAPTGSQTVEATTNENGQATVQIRQAAGQFDPGQTQVRVDVVRPKLFGEPELVVESGITTVNWSTPALTIRAIGPRTAGLNEAFNYRVEVSNPGDQETRGVKLRTRDLPLDLEFISSSPKPTVYGNQYEWDLGNIAPGGTPRIVDVQLKSAVRGNQELCFAISSETDQLATEACAQTEIVAPCIGVELDGPTEVKVGEQAEFEITISNQCEESLENVDLKILYDNGLLAPGAGNPIGAKVGTLAFNEEKTMTIVFDAVSAGEQCFQLKVSADGGHTANGKRCLEVVPGGNANVNLQMEGQRIVIVGGKALIRGDVTNVGDVPLNNVSVLNRFSSSLTPDRVTDKFPHRWTGPENDELIFDVGTLAPGQSVVVETEFVANQIDGDAFSEMTVSSPDVTPSTRRYDMRIQDLGPGGVGSGSGAGSDSVLGGGQGREPGIQIPEDGETGPAQPDFGNPRNPKPGPRNPTPPFGGSGAGGGIEIPNDAGAGQLNQNQGNLTVNVQTLDRQVVAGGQSRIEFSVTNNSNLVDSNVDISMLMPPSLQLVGWEDLQNPLSIVGGSPDGTRTDLGRVLSMRAGETLRFVAVVRGLAPGQATFEVRAASDRSVGTTTATDTVLVAQ